ncbi:MAG: sigma-70 family RNA polymerase sigma factor [Clostridia bacterium]|nr:sigma-70 family RNA polymerase sigma factor [Clostridia bacterium]
MDDEKIIDLFFERSEQAITEISKKYGGVFMNVAMNVLGNRSDADECLNDAYLGLWNAIPPARPNPLLAFACRIVRNKSLDRYRSKGFRSERTGCEECIDELENYLSSGESIENEIGEKRLSDCINSFLDLRNEVDRMIFVRRFFYMDTCRDIAKASGLSSGAVRTRLSRIKADLKSYLDEKGIEI